MQAGGGTTPWRSGAVATLLVSATLLSPARGADALLLGGEVLPAALRAIDDQSIVLADSSEAERQVPLDQLVRWSHPKPATTAPMLVLRDGSRLVVAPLWAGTPPLTITGDQVTVRGKRFAITTFPRSALAAIEFLPGQLAPTGVVELPDTTDSVWLDKADRVDGTIVGFAKRLLTIKFADEELPLDVDRLVRAEFAARPHAAKAPARVEVYLDDGTRLRVSQIAAGSDGIELELESGVRTTIAGVESIAALVGLGSQLRYLSDLQPAEYRHTPYFSLEWPLGRDAATSGQSLRVGQLQYPKGLAMHSAARAVYHLPADSARFAASVAIDDAAQGQGSVVFRAYVARGGQLQQVYESPIVRGGEPPLDVAVDVAGGQLLVLVVDYADRGDQQDHGVWLDARLELAD